MLEEEAENEWRNPRESQSRDRLPEEGSLHPSSIVLPGALLIQTLAPTDVAWTILGKISGDLLEYDCFTTIHGSSYSSKLTR